MQPLDFAVFLRISPILAITGDAGMQGDVQIARNLLHVLGDHLGPLGLRDRAASGGCGRCPADEMCRVPKE